MALIVAHRGDPLTHRENTVPAFQAAEAAGADMLELDLQRSRDGAVVVLHDTTLERLWGVPAAVSALTYEEILQATAADAYQVPLLTHVLAASRLPLMLDVAAADVVDPMAQVLKAARAVGRALVVGGNREAHRRARSLLPGVATGLSWGALEPPDDLLLDALRPRYFNPEWHLLRYWQQVDGYDVVGAMRRRGIGVSVWTVDDLEEVEALERDGVDLIITNRVRDIGGRRRLGDATERRW
jgi:glycerophosphoryl diester phosphodiesterase